MPGCHNQTGSRGKLGVLSCKSGEPFGEALLQSLEKRFEKEGCQNGGPIKIPAKETHFGNTEVKVEIGNVRGYDLYVVQSLESGDHPDAKFTDHLPLRDVELPFTLPEDIDLDTLVAVNRPFSVDENLRALLSTLDAAKRCNAHYTTAVIPVFSYARQDKALSREGITASRVAEEIEGHGADCVFTLDIHNRAIQGFFRRAPLENLHASKLLIAYVQDHLNRENLVVVSPDEGGIARANYFAKRLGRHLAMGYKRRDYTQASKVEEFRILGDVVRRHRTLEEQIEAIRCLIEEGATGVSPEEALKKVGEILELKAEGLDVLFVDDMIATAGSLVSGVTKVRELGAKSVWFATALPLFTYPAVERIDKLYEEGLIQGVVGTNAVYHSDKFKEAHPWYHEVRVEQLFADAIYNMNHYLSISKLLE